VRSQRNLSTAAGAATDLLDLQIEQINRNQERESSWETLPVRKLHIGVLRALACVASRIRQLDRGTLHGCQKESFLRECANGANYLAFLAERARRQGGQETVP